MTNDHSVLLISSDIIVIDRLIERFVFFFSPGTAVSLVAIYLPQQSEFND